MNAGQVRHFLIYLVIGTVVFAIDAGSFQLLVLTRMVLPLATTISYVFAVTTHFSLNRWLNFRNFERSVAAQARTYAAIVFLQYLLTMAIIEAGVHLGHLTPLVAKIVAIVVNIPVGFLAHRYLTFGDGIAAKIRALQGGRPSHRA